MTIQNNKFLSTTERPSSGNDMSMAKSSDWNYGQSVMPDQFNTVSRPTSGSMILPELSSTSEPILRQAQNDNTSQ